MAKVYVLKFTQIRFIRTLTYTVKVGDEMRMLQHLGVKVFQVHIMVRLELAYQIL